MNIEIDTQAIIEQIRDGKALTCKEGALAPLIKQLTEAALQVEIESHLAQGLDKNRKNVTTSKTMKSDVANFKLDVPRDRTGSFEPQIVKKNQTYMSEQIERKILSLYGYPKCSKKVDNAYKKLELNCISTFNLF